jgi:uncharacterized protein
MMGPWLLDVNVLLSVLWPYHSSHRDARRWFQDHSQEGWATCPLTETGFLRVVTNPAFTTDPPLIPDALAILAASKQSNKAYRFWPAEISGEEAVERFGKRVTGHKQIFYAYLLALAIRNQGKLVTFDQRILQLAPEGSPEWQALEILQ